MQGSHNAKLFVTEYLKNDLPTRISDYRSGNRDEGKWYLDDETLPTPTVFLTHEPLALDEWPCIITLAMSTTNLSRSNYTYDSLYDPLYRVVYTMRTYVWVRAEGADECTMMRDRLTTVVRAALLDHPCLKANDPDNFLEVMIDEGSMREEFSDLTLLKGDRFLAGAYISYDLTVNERITRKPIGTVDEFQIEQVFLDEEGEEIELP